MTLELDQRFQVSETRDLTDSGSVIARYQPGLSYRVTERNRTFVQGMIDDGSAKLDPVGWISTRAARPSGGLKVAAASGDASGHISVGKLKEN